MERMTQKEFFYYVENSCGKQLTSEQLEAILYNEGNSCLISTAGSGKSTVLVIKVAYNILVKGLSPKQIAVVTFSKASAIAMKHKFKTMFNSIIDYEVSFSTIHSFAYRIIKDFEFKLSKMNSSDKNKKFKFI